MDEQDDKEYLNNPLDKVQYRHNVDDNRDYFTDEYDDAEDRIGSWEAKYSAMGEE